MIVDLFSGCGGWDEGARTLDPDLHAEIVGVEIMPEAVDTARAAGHEVVRGSVAEVIGPDLRLGGLIASPPCQAFSAAGKRLGKHDIPIIYEALAFLAAHSTLDDVHLPLPAHFAERCVDPRSILVVEPMRWILATRPEWIALEQVPAVLPLWEWMADRLEPLGYSVWTGKLRSEEYGVPQTRERAFLIASRTRTVSAPPPTHAGYDSRRRAPKRGHEDRPRYVTMAEALGWGMTRRPYPAIACSRTTGGPDREKVGGSGARKSLYDERDAGHWTRFRLTGNNSIAGGPLATRECDEPAMTVGSRADLWAFSRPATTVAGDPRVSAPGWRGAPRDYDEDGNYIGKRSMDEAIRVSIEEALVLQSFPPDYPLVGTQTKRFLQVGNAVPPRFAAHVLSMATGKVSPG